MKKLYPGAPPPRSRADSRWVCFSYQTFFKDTREARNKKENPGTAPKDTLAWIELGRDSLVKIPRVQSYKVPEKQGTWLAYLLERSPGAGSRSDSSRAVPDSLTRIRQLLARADSLSRAADSLRSKVGEIAAKGFSVLPPVSTPKGRQGRPSKKGYIGVEKSQHRGRKKSFPSSVILFFCERKHLCHRDYP